MGTIVHKINEYGGHAFFPVLLIWLTCFLHGTVSGQRETLFRSYSPAYFDSVRVLVNDTAREHYVIKAYRLRVDDKITIDGRLEEEAWKNADRAGGLLEKEPYPLIPMSEETEFSILYDGENLYLGVWCWDSQPERIVQQLSPRGTSGPDNLFIFIDSYHDHRTGYKFVVSPTGVQVDELRYDDVKRDGNWKGVWYSEGSVDERGWYAEIKIPFYNFRYPRKDAHTWGFNIMRNISRDASRGQWKPHLPEWDNTTRMSQMGHIEDIRDISPGRTFEIRPYTVAGASRAVQTGNAQTLSFGGDIRYSPSPSLTADFTFHPDYAQVDADVFEINLTRFPTRFAERRPFFTERINIFNTPRELFYSRRIGAKGDIIGGAKMTGKLQHGIEFGFLGNVTGESFMSSPLQSSEEAGFGVVRVKKDILGSSSLGILAAAKENGSYFNRVLGIDGNFLLGSHNLLDFQLSKGQTEADNQQDMSYYLSYIRTGDLLGFQINIDRVEPEFEINRIGYLQKEAGRGWNKAAGLFRVSPRINKNQVRRIILNLGVDYQKDLLTGRYIDTWLQRFSDFSPDPVFGTVITDDAGKRSISGGQRESDNYRLGGDITVNFMNEMSVTADYRHYTATELTGSYTGNLFKMNYATRPMNLGPRFAGIFSAFAGTLYNFDRKYVGSQEGLTVDGEGRLSRRLMTRLQAGLTRTQDPDGHNDGRYYKISSNSTWMFTKDFYFRLHAQGLFGTTWYGERAMLNEYLLSGLLSWEYRPGSFLYLAWNESLFDLENSNVRQHLQLKNRAVIFKLSYFFSI